MFNIYNVLARLDNIASIAEFTSLVDFLVERICVIFELVKLGSTIFIYITKRKHLKKYEKCFLF